MRSVALLTALLMTMTAGDVLGQAADFTAVRAEVDFSKKLRDWDGFGVNYVETSQTFNYDAWPQDYGGFRFLSQADRVAIVDLVFGDDGLQPGLVKMFLDPLHQSEPGASFDHARTTGNMRFFVREGLRRTRARGDNLAVITTLYGPPAYVTRQNVLRGRDLDPARKADLARYMVDWVKYLREEEQLPVRYLSLHNEGESWRRWPADGEQAGVEEGGHDYNFFWSPEQVVEMLGRVRRELDEAGLGDVGVTNGEPTNWYRFGAWGYADALSDNEAALRDLALITSHGFYVGRQEAGRWFGPHSSRGTDLLREKRPLLHAWTTSTSWDVKNDNLEERRYVMDAGFAKELHGNIYEAKVNGIIPWAFIQTASQWNRSDPNPGSAIRVYDDGTWEVKKGYYYYKQLSRAGRPGMSVVQTSAMDSEIALIGFAGNGTGHPDAVVVINFGPNDWDVAIEVKGTGSRFFRVYRTTGQEVYIHRTTAEELNDGSDNYRDLGEIEVGEGVIRYRAPANSATTFFGGEG